MSRDRRGQPLPAWKKALFAAVATVLAFALLEGGLALCGVEPFLWQEDPYVGFEPGAPLFVEAGSPDGTRVRTTARNKLRYFNAQSFPAAKAPGVRRVFCVGGSTTFGRPYDDATSFAGWLRAFLTALDSEHRWEVINAGGISYASYRIAIVMEELAAYEPDLFIVYCGHNEFLEKRTYANILDAPWPVRRASSWLGRSRTYALIDRLVHDRGPGVGESRDLLPGEVDALLDNSIGPEAYRRDDALRQGVLAHFRFNLERIVAIARSSGAKVVLVSPASNLRDCAPFKSEVASRLTSAERRRLSSLLERGGRALAEGRSGVARETLDHAVAMDPRHAGARFLRGRALVGLGEIEAARRDFLAARDEDVCPLRALGAIAGAVRAVAADLDAPLIDFAATVEERARDGIPGEDLFLDHVHPTIAGSRLLALEIVDWLRARGLVPPADERAGEVVAGVVRAVEGRIDRVAHAAALRNLAQVLRWAGKEREAGKLAVRAVEDLPDDAVALYLAGCEYDRRGDVARAAQLLGEAVRLRPDDHRVRNDLGRLLARQGQLVAALSHFRAAVAASPDFAPAHHNLGLAFERGGEPAAAEVAYRRALSLAPSADACHDLGLLLTKLGRYDEAEGVFASALALRPDHARVHQNLGVLHAKQGRLSEAFGCFERALEIDPENAAARRNLEHTRSLLREER